MVRLTSPPLSTFLPSSDFNHVSLANAQLKPFFKISELDKYVQEFYLLVLQHIPKTSKRIRQRRAVGKLVYLFECDYVLVAGEDFFAGE